MNDDITTPGLLRRLAAMGYDALLVFSLLFGATGLYQFVAGQLSSGNQDSQALATGDVVKAIEPVAAGPLYSLFLLLVIVAFFTWFWRRNGQTLGMQAWRLRIDNLDGGRISYGQALTRFAGACLSTACLGLGYLWILVDKDKCSWHDRLSRSRVVLLPKRRK